MYLRDFLRQSSSVVAGVNASSAPANERLGLAKVQVVPAERVSLRTFRNQRSSSSQVFFSGNRLKMGGVATPPVPTEMVKVKPFGYCAHEHLVGKSVRDFAGITSPELSVPGGMNAAGPLPTTGADMVFIDEFPEQFFTVDGSYCHRPTLTTKATV